MVLGTTADDAGRKVLVELLVRNVLDLEVGAHELRDLRLVVDEYDVVLLILAARSFTLLLLRSVALEAAQVI